MILQTDSGVFAAFCGEVAAFRGRVDERLSEDERDGFAHEIRQLADHDLAATRSVRIEQRGSAFVEGNSLTTAGRPRAVKASLKLMARGSVTPPVMPREIRAADAAASVRRASGSLAAATARLRILDAREPRESDVPDLVMHIDVIGAMSEKDIDLYLRYYATDEDREEWLRQFPDAEIPPKAVPPYDPHRFLPEAHRCMATRN